VTGSQLHKFLWCATDVPTGPTSITNARQCRIDAVQYLSNQMEVLEVAPVPRLPYGQVIPNNEYPSDHFPVCVSFRLKDSYQMHRELARAWLECVAGREKLHPLTREELRTAFDFFDRDRSERIHRHDLEEACIDLNCNFHVDVQQCLLDCFPDHQISYDYFIRAYEARLNHERIRSIGELEYAFKYFSGGAQNIALEKLEEAFREITPISFSDEEVKDMLGRLSLPAGQEVVDVRSFCEIVCKASFPHRDRSKFSAGGLPGARPSTSECQVRPSTSEYKQRNRASTKELCIRLDKMHEHFQLTSPVHANSFNQLSDSPPLKTLNMSNQPGAVGQPQSQILSPSSVQEVIDGRCVSPGCRKILPTNPTVE
jgi:Ca2+-binding EF-hand superfamily protein